MARATRKRIYYKKTTKWSPNIQEINTTTIQAPINSTFHSTFVLAFNPTQVNTAVSQVYTVKRLETSFYIDVNQYSGNLEDIAAYIMYVPQGMTVTTTYNIDHPEYIMAYKLLGSPSNDTTTNNPGQQYQPYRVNTRLSRKLNTGDSVVLFVKGNNTATEAGNVATSFNFHGLVRWWTKAN